MIGIAICTHSDFAQGLCNAVEMIAGPQEQLTALNFMGDIGLEEYGEQLKKDSVTAVSLLLILRMPHPLMRH